MNENEISAAPVAVITGASEGLGAALARELANRGWRLGITARRAIPLQLVAASLAPAPVVALAGDVANPDHARRLVASTLERFGRIDLLVNNASTLGPTPLREIAAVEPDQFARVFAVNVFAPHLLAKEVLARAADAQLVAITSDAASAAYPAWGPYGASKAALEQLWRVLAEERPELSLLIVDPGEMDTTMHRDAIPDADPATLLDPRACAAVLAEEILLRRAATGVSKLEIAAALRTAGV
jgi:NAD(P)-dependent dehydrogenase (short-subunit alcohol dehydrogenase family)